eukprot:scaffold93115_cov21-Tisochrysis_lutea.AAC.1
MSSITSPMPSVLPLLAPNANGIKPVLKPDTPNHHVQQIATPAGACSIAEAVRKELRPPAIHLQPPGEGIKETVGVQCSFLAPSCSPLPARVTFLMFDDFAA